MGTDTNLPQQLHEWRAQVARLAAEIAERRAALKEKTRELEALVRMMERAG